LTRNRILKAILLVVLIPLCSSCKPSRGEIIVAVDRSGSVSRWLMANQWTLFDSIVDQATAMRCKMRLWTYDSTAVELFGPNVPEGRRTFNALKPELKPRDDVKFTNPADLLESLVPIVDKAGHPVAICILTDGGCELESEKDRLARVAKRLSEMPNVSVHVIGIESDTRSCWRAAFADMGRRFTMGGWSEQDQELGKLVSEVNGWQQTDQQRGI
jgi:hypothetical protein